MKSTLKKFQCQECKSVGQIELIHDSAWISTLLSVNEYGKIIYGETEVSSYDNAWYQCTWCNKRINIGASEEDLIEFLERL